MLALRCLPTPERNAVGRPVQTLPTLQSGDLHNRVKKRESMTFAKSCLSALAFATIIAIGSASAATCTNASLKGVFGSLDGGLNNGQPEVTLAQITFDGIGSLSGTLTNSLNGTISTGKFTGTYSVAKNCAGSFALGLPGGNLNYNFVLDDSKKGSLTIRNADGLIKTGFTLAEGAAVCATIGKKASFAGSLGGAIQGFGQIAGSGQVNFDGKGNISGTVVFSMGGNMSTVPITGTYIENANCTGTAEFTPEGFTTANFNLVVVNAGKEILIIETDPSTTVSGTLQK